MSRSSSIGALPPRMNRALWCRLCLVIGGSVLFPLMLASAKDNAGINGPAADVVRLGQATLRIQSPGAAPDVGLLGVHDWVLRSASIVSAYFGEFPVQAVTIRVSTSDSSSMGSGRTYGYPQPRIEVNVGQHISLQSLNDDWVLVHEMSHLSLPAIDESHTWFAEGVAVYVEGVARAQAGNISETRLWGEYATSMPKGLPQLNDEGLDRTHTWARTYWGGALYCLLADVKIREKTNNRRGLQDALRAIAQVGAGMSEEWPIEHILSVGDAATATSVMTDLYLKMKDQPYTPDLDALWIDLGIQINHGIVSFDDTARLGAVRRAITRMPAGHATR
jgi:hypothetical protein